MFANARRMIAILLTLTMAAGIGPVMAEELEEQQQKLESVQQQMKVYQNKTAESQQKVDNFAEKLRGIQTELDDAMTNYNKLRSRQQQTEQQIEQNEVILGKAEKNLAERSQVLNRRMRDIYKNGQVSYVDVLFGASDFTDFSIRMDLVLQKKAELEHDRVAIVELKKQAETAKAAIESRRNAQQDFLDSAVSERDTNERAYQELLDTSRRIEQMIRSSQAGKGGTIGSGILVWPTSGPITSPFGWRTHPIFGTSRYHSGIDIGADYGDSVVAADGGVVIYADWMGGYGKAVIIDHGGGISTLYAHNSELVVAEGQRVAKGQLISRVGSTGYSTGPHLHFEVREGGSPVNPMGYLP